MRRIALIGFVVIAGAVITWQTSRLNAPAIVRSLRAIPEVARVEYTGPHDAPLVVIHLRDWHHVRRDLCKLEGIDFDANLSAAENVQEEQLAIARYLIREHGIKSIYSEGLSKESMPDLRLRLDVLKDLDRLAVIDGTDVEAFRTQREFRLEVGTPGHLLYRQEIEAVLPLEDAQALKDAAPIQTKEGVRFDPAKLDARRRAMVAQLSDRGIAVIVLGGSHDLGTYLGKDVLYVQVTPQGYPGE